MTFDEMTSAMGASSRRMRRAGWADVAMGDGSRRGEMWIEMRMDEESRPFAVLMLKDGDRLIQAPRWMATVTDKGATDWVEVIT